MSIPSDPYNAGSRRPFDDGDILDPIDETTADQTFVLNSSGLELPTESFETGAGLAGSASDAANEQASATFTSSAGDGEAPSDTAAPEGTVATNGAASPAGDAHGTVASDGLSFDGPAAVDAEGAADAVADPAVADTTVSATAANDIDAATTEEPAFSWMNPEPAAAPTGRSELAASVGLGGATLPEPEPVAEPEDPAPTAAFLAGHEEEKDAERLDRWSSKPAISAVPDAPKGRGLVHTGLLFLSILLTPVAWFLLSDGHRRLAEAATSNDFTMAGVGELVGGLIVTGFLWIAARASSLGITVSGAIVAVFGLFGVVLPSSANELVLQPLADTLGSQSRFFNDLTQNLADDTLSGLLLVFGVLMVLTGVVSHHARRRGIEYGSVTTQRRIAGAE